MQFFSVRIFAALLLLTITVCAAIDHNLHFHFRGISEEYETVYPKILRKTRPTRNGHSEEQIDVHIASESGEEFTLHLTLNEMLISPQFSSKYYTKEGVPITDKNQVNCYYQGRVLEHPDWNVAMDSCQGLRGSFGSGKNSTHYQLEPLSLNDSLEQPHALYTVDDSNDDGECGTETHTKRSLSILGLDKENITRAKRQAVYGYYIIELYIVNDNAQYRYYGSVSRTVSQALALTNFADSIYRRENIRLVIVYMETWTQVNRILFSPVATNTLSRLRIFSFYVRGNFDAMMLITANDFVSNTVGIAYVNTMCGVSSVGAIQDRHISTTKTGSTFAHEVGHLLSLEHDYNTCACYDPTGRCVMAAVITYATTLFSSCSRSGLSSALTRSIKPLGRCLENEPVTTVGNPVCGNGIRERNEICDCGTPQECTDRCCDAPTCRLAAGAQCLRGECCTNTCQFKIAGTTCRNASGQCDVAEYCTGAASDCPDDVYLQDSTPCDNNQAYCFSGECRSYNRQCQYYFAANKGSDRCFQSYNTRGDHYGNCGSNGNSFVPCSDSNVMCGQLFCQQGRFQNRVTSVYVLDVGIYDRFLRTQQCVAFTPPPSSDTLSPGLVEDGIKCGSGKLCYEQRCVAVSNLNLSQCPTDSNRQICSGNGTCNNKGRCSCNQYFSGNSCEISPDECALGIDNCEQNCVNTNSSYECTCNDGYVLESNNHTCTLQCGGTLTGFSGSFQTPGWPNGYPQENFQCEWNIELPNPDASVAFTIDGSSYGINGQSPCQKDYVQFFDGVSKNATSVYKLCYFDRPESIVSTSFRARVVFAGSTDNHRPRSRVGVKVNYRSNVNECLKKNGGCSDICVDTPSSFQCQCSNGYQLMRDDRNCSDVNECTRENGGCDHICINTDGSFMCQCTSGYTLDSNGKTCHDINECRDNTHNCAQVCTNTAGSFTCSCNSGYTLSRGNECNDTDECTTNNGNCQHTCHNLLGSYECQCRSGFTLHRNGWRCIDIDECVSGGHNCEDGCRNTPGSYTCYCDQGFSLAADRRSCTCGSTLNGTSGRFNSPGWPRSYPQKHFQCEWIIRLPNARARIEFTIDRSAYGINGPPSCSRDHIEFFDGTHSGARSMHRLCRFDNPGAITTTSREAKVVFASTINPHRPSSRVGVSVSYRSLLS